MLKSILAQKGCKTHLSIRLSFVYSWIDDSKEGLMERSENLILHLDKQVSYGLENQHIKLEGALHSVFYAGASKRPWASLNE